jgi:RNA-directed DNA polymerase
LNFNDLTCQEKSKIKNWSMEFKVLVRKTSSQWVLEADIKGFFDNIDFAWLLENIPVHKKVLKAWLHSGYVEKGNLFPTLKGVPQGGK